MKKLVFAAAMILVSIGANAQWRNNNNRDRRYDDRHGNRYDNRRDDDPRGYDDRFVRNNLGDRIDDFQREARRRIADGIAQGSISSREARGLMRDVERIERKEQIFWRDRVLDPRERRELVDDLYALHREITHEKRDNERSTYDDFGRNDHRYGQRNRGWWLHNSGSKFRPAVFLAFVVTFPFLLSTAL